MDGSVGGRLPVDPRRLCVFFVDGSDPGNSSERVPGPDELRVSGPSSSMMAGSEAWCLVTVRGADGSLLASWVMEGIGPPGLAAVDTIARLTLVAGRGGGTVILDAVCPALHDLLVLAGLAGAGLAGAGLAGAGPAGAEPAVDRLVREVDGEPEEGEQALGVEKVEEEAERGDPPP